MKKTYFRILALLAILCALCAGSAKAQTARISVDSLAVEAGNPIRLKIAAMAKTGSKVAPPDKLSLDESGMVLTMATLKTDTIKGDKEGEVIYQFNYAITSLADSAFEIGGFPVRIDADTFYTNRLTVEFTPIQGIDSAFVAGIDTSLAGIPIFDMKPIKEMPWTFKEFWSRYGELIIILLIVAIVASLLTYIVVRKIRNQPIIPFSKPKEPAHKQALFMLGSLKDKKLCEEGKYKEYYTCITEVLKNYISERWGTSVMESSTTETLAVLKGKIGSKAQAFGFMKEISATADFVKFAKMEPDPSENARMLQMAFDIVESTKQTDQEILQEEKVEPQLKFAEAVKLTLGQNYFNFKSRARRSEYWWYRLAYSGTLLALSVTTCLIKESDIAAALSVAMLLVAMSGLVPMIGASIRRMHDTGRSGWWYLISLVPLAGLIAFALLCLPDSQRGPNRWGGSPKYPNSRNLEFMK